MMEAVDKGDSAQFTRDEVLDSTGWNLLNFLMDARTGLGRFHNFRISNYNLMMALIDHCTHASIDEILQLPDVKERVELYRKHETLFKEQIQRCGKVYQNLVLLDLQKKKPSMQGTVLSFMPFIRSAIFLFIKCGDSRNRTSCSPPENRFSIAAREPISVN